MTRKCYLKRTGRILKKTPWLEVSELQQKFELTQILSSRFKVSEITQYLGINRSSYYYWQKTKEQKTLSEKDDVDLIKLVFENSKNKYGYRRIQMHLEKDYGVKMNHKKIRRLMKKYKLIAKVRQKKPYKEIMKKNKEHTTCANWLNREFKKTEACKYYLTDITYLYYGKGQKAYLSVIKDMVTGEIAAYKVSRSITMPLVLDTINIFKQKFNTQGILLHSDQGFHYTNPEYQKLLKDCGIIQSMSRKATPIDNAPMESFYGHFKDEVDYKLCKTFEELVALIDRYMYYYNYKRYQWSKLKMTPAQYRSHLLFAC